MIRTDKEYNAALLKLRQNEEVLEKQRQHFECMNLSADQIQLAQSPLKSLYHQLKQKVEAYERIKK